MPAPQLVIPAQAGTQPGARPTWIPAFAGMTGRRLTVRTVVVVAAFVGLVACESKQKLTTPAILASPYERPMLLAVAPLANESGMSSVDGARVADLFVEQAQQAEGIDAIPVNRTMWAMRSLKMAAVSSPHDAEALMKALGCDALIAGTVTAYNAYSPPKFGAAIQLFLRDRQEPIDMIDPIALSRAPREPALGAMQPQLLPSSQAGAVFDASNHQTLAWLEQYAAGRTVPDSAFGKDIYLVNMELYTQFAAYRLLHDLLERERARLTPPAPLATADATDDHR